MRCGLHLFFFLRCDHHLGCDFLRCDLHLIFCKMRYSSILLFEMGLSSRI
ncbi:hypothetical protein SLEP1_g22533 [Rubroshorea leprosula]|uniref:Uncharacterized protein n=1 Tax=Rubroshorea leprosula TaxID=152421 RepID=A0AAV5JIC6_9ROSI|nr:hypothetical protein SLEP1_g22533 [Rubroshorea leprosula]